MPQWEEELLSGVGVTHQPRGGALSWFGAGFALRLLPRSRSGRRPRLDLGLFGNRPFSVGLAINITFMLSFSSFMFVLTLLLQAGFHDSPLRAGLTFLPMGALSMVTSLAGAGLSRYTACGSSPRERW